MNFSQDPRMVRVDFFKPSGKWVETLAVRWLDYGNSCTLIYDDFLESLRVALKLRPDQCHPNTGPGPHYSHSGCSAVCLSPYHKNAYPLLLTAPWTAHRTTDEEQAGQRNEHCSLSIPDYLWKLGEPADGRLFARVTINDIPFHAEALPVTPVGTTGWEGTTPIAEEMYGDFDKALGGDGPFQVLYINNKPYAVFLTPHRQ